jgi:hypothetical protein
MPASAGACGVSLDPACLPAPRPPAPAASADIDAGFLLDDGEAGGSAAQRASSGGGQALPAAVAVDEVVSEEVFEYCVGGCCLGRLLLEPGCQLDTACWPAG